MMTMVAAMSTPMSSSLPRLSLHTQPIPKFCPHTYFTPYFTIQSVPTNCNSTAPQSSSPKASSSSSYANNTDPMLPPYNVLITGSTKGIGYALAKEFLKSGDNVIICSRSEERVKSALDSFKLESGKQHVWGTKCDVRDGDDVKNLVAFAQEQLKYIDIWVFHLHTIVHLNIAPTVPNHDNDCLSLILYSVGSIFFFFSSLQVLVVHYHSFNEFIILYLINDKHILTETFLLDLICQNYSSILKVCFLNTGSQNLMKLF
ncbi:hypothetical protein ACS0TY_003070 [Phlomoides rotata]